MSRFPQHGGLEAHSAQPGTRGAAGLDSDLETLALAQAFEACALPELSHESHIRLAWHYLRQDPLATVLQELPRRFLRYAASKGAPESYHETITFAFTCIVNERVRSSGEMPWHEFARFHPDLFDRGLLLQFYERKVLDSELARSTFLWPGSPSSRRDPAGVLQSRGSSSNK